MCLKRSGSRLSDELCEPKGGCNYGKGRSERADLEAVLDNATQDAEVDSHLAAHAQHHLLPKVEQQIGRK